ncbi:Hypothetical protein FNO222_1806 [Francisella orientalis]|uniref:Uncharacterized protein n=1 Tax=Francisella orientalis TaxID=299583 RepID=A0ABM5U826_9GAMM|nr:hypothetical protein FNO12_1791 [Francisella orientalis FNO12]AKN87827.1 Hypothetical protein FNO24_1793 [Francisella orientalis FNO24]AKN89366.1 Hypothetical protein FNO190_1791 [Francisella orientalis]AKU06125.1 Hypothetical protein FNO01_1791 [Francisella orientalis]QEN21042.1 Hypothetical protein FNO39_1806 [Francisella orientalis]
MIKIISSLMIAQLELKYKVIRNFKPYRYYKIIN